MDFMNEYGLLIAVATPVGLIGLLNVLLALGGEKGTLLFPSLRPYPTVLTQSQAMVIAEPEVAAQAASEPAPQAAERPARTPVVAGYDETDERLARQAA